MTTSQDDAIKGVQYAFLLGGIPRGPGMERQDLLAKNAGIYVSMGQSIEKHADKNIKVLVVANPANTNALACMKSAPSVPKSNFTALTRLDYNRSRGLLVQEIQKKLNEKVNISDLQNIALWGNHSNTQFPDASNATYKGKPVYEILTDKEYFQKDFIKIIQQRGSAIIQERGLSSASSAAKAACDHMRDWVLGTEGIMNVIS